MIIHNTFLFPIAVNGTPLCGEWQRPVSHKTWYGVAGALTFTSGVQLRQISIEATMTNYATRLTMELDQNLMRDALDVPLSGTLNIDGELYTRCLFMGWTPTSTAFYDGSGQHAWTQMGRLSWEQTR